MLIMRFFFLGYVCSALDSLYCGQLVYYKIRQGITQSVQMLVKYPKKGLTEWFTSFAHIHPSIKTVTMPKFILEKYTQVRLGSLVVIESGFHFSFCKYGYGWKASLRGGRRYELWKFSRQNVRNRYSVNSRKKGVKLNFK